MNGKIRTCSRYLIFSLQPATKPACGQTHTRQIPWWGRGKPGSPPAGDAQPGSLGSPTHPHEGQRGWHRPGRARSPRPPPGPKDSSAPPAARPLPTPHGPRPHRRGPSSTDRGLRGSGSQSCHPSPRGRASPLPCEMRRVRTASGCEGRGGVRRRRKRMRRAAAERGWALRPRRREGGAAAGAGAKPLLPPVLPPPLLCTPSFLLRSFLLLLFSSSRSAATAPRAAPHAVAVRGRGSQVGAQAGRRCRGAGTGALSGVGWVGENGGVGEGGGWQGPPGPTGSRGSPEPPAAGRRRFSVLARGAEPEPRAERECRAPRGQAGSGAGIMTTCGVYCLRPWSDSRSLRSLPWTPLCTASRWAGWARRGLSPCYSLHWVRITARETGQNTMDGGIRLWQRGSAAGCTWNKIGSVLIVAL